MGRLRIGQNLGGGNPGDTVSVRLPNGEVVQAKAATEVNKAKVLVATDEAGKHYAYAEGEGTASVTTRQITRQRPRRKPVDVEDYFFKVLQADGLIEGFDDDVDLDLTGYTPVGITNTGEDYHVVIFKINGSNYDFLFLSNNEQYSYVSSTSIPFLYIGGGWLRFFHQEGTEDLASSRVITPSSWESDNLGYDSNSPIQALTPNLIGFTCRNNSVFITRSLTEMPFDITHNCTTLLPGNFSQFFRNNNIDYIPRDIAFKTDEDPTTSQGGSYIMSGTILNAGSTHTFTHTVNTTVPDTIGLPSNDTNAARNWTNSVNSNYSLDRNISTTDQYKIRKFDDEYICESIYTENTSASRQVSSEVSQQETWTRADEFSPWQLNPFVQSSTVTEDQSLSSTKVYTTIIRIPGGVVENYIRNESSSASITFDMLFTGIGNTTLGSFNVTSRNLSKYERRETSTNNVSGETASLLLVGLDCAICEIEPIKYTSNSVFIFPKEVVDSPLGIISFGQTALANAPSGTLSNLWNWDAITCTENIDYFMETENTPYWKLYVRNTEYTISPFNDSFILTSNNNVSISEDLEITASSLENTVGLNATWVRPYLSSANYIKTVSYGNNDGTYPHWNQLTISEVNISESGFDYIDTLCSPTYEGRAVKVYSQGFSRSGTIIGNPVTIQIESVGDQLINVKSIGDVTILFTEPPIADYFCLSSTTIVPSDDFTSVVWKLVSSNADCNFYTVLDDDGNETVELAISQIPTETAEQDEWRADIYRFNTTSLKWERRPNGVSALSELTSPSDFISYREV